MKTKKTPETEHTGKFLLGWREWVALPELGLPAIKAKIDTGAKTSALHAFYVKPFKRDGADWVQFDMHPLQRNTQLVIRCEAPLVARRAVSDSGGHREMRYVIAASMVFAENSLPIELTLTNRDSMRFRMLLGRRAMERHFRVDPGCSYLLGKLKYRKLYGLKPSDRPDHSPLR